MQTILSYGGGIIMGTAILALVIFITNRSRRTLEQAVRLSGCSESELRELIQEGLLTSRRKYVVFGPRSIDVDEIIEARAAHIQIKRTRAEIDATVRKAAEDAAARMNESDRISREQARLQQEEVERTERMYAEILKNLRTQLNLIPPDVAQALRVLGLPQNASFSDIRQRYRLLVKQYHPDAGGDQEQFVQIHAAYTCVTAWIESHA